MRGYALPSSPNQAFTDGELDDVQICRCRYTADDIAAVHPPPPFVDHRWSLNEMDGTAAPEMRDASVFPVHGVFHNLDDTDRITDVPAMLAGGWALRFDAAAGAYVALEQPIMLRDRDDLTLSLWYRGTEADPNSYFGRVLVGAGGNDVVATLQIAADAKDPAHIGKVEFRRFGTGHVIRSMSVVNDGQWHHIAYVQHGDTATGVLYIDGVPEAAGDPSDNLDAWDALGTHFYVKDFMRGYSQAAGPYQAFTDGDS